MDNFILVITGPTAAGKSSVAMKIAKALNTDIVSCDSAQIYKYMDIGTAKPTMEEREQVKHHLIDYVMPDEEFSAVRYKIDCDKAIRQLFDQGKTPILVGGTGMYLNAVLYEMSFGSACKSDEIRSELNRLLIEKGSEYLHGMLKELDYETAMTLHKNDAKRIIRAIEIYKVSGRKKSEQIDNFTGKKRYNYHFAVLSCERQNLYERINRRVDMMMEKGLLQEVEKLVEMGYKDCKSLQAIGYKELIGYLDGEYGLDQAVEKIKQFTRNYAKRQLTWFRKVPDAVWYDMGMGEDEAAKQISYNFTSLL